LWAGSFGVFHGGCEINEGTVAESPIDCPEPVFNLRQVQSPVPTLHRQREIHDGDMADSGHFQAIFGTHHVDAQQLRHPQIRTEERLWSGSEDRMAEVCRCAGKTTVSTENESSSSHEGPRFPHGQTEKNSSETGGEFFLNIDELPRSLKKLFLNVDFSNYFMFRQGLENLAEKARVCPVSDAFCFTNMLKLCIKSVSNLYKKCTF